MSQASVAAIRAVLPGESEVGALILARDWSDTALGPIGGWPAGLRHALGLLMAAPLPMLLFWGSEQVALYNDAYARTIGGRHPASLGGTARECWAHVWDELEPSLTQTFATGAPLLRRDQRLMIVRDDAQVETFFDVAFSAVRADDGAIGGVLAIVCETTLRLAVGVAEIGTWDYDPIADLLVWDDRTWAMFGMRPAGPSTIRGFYDALHPEDLAATKRAFLAAIDPAQRAAYDVEYRTIGKEDGQIRWIAAKGRGLFDAEGRCTRAIGTTLDITARKLAQEALRESEQRFRIIADSAPALIWLCDETGELVFANQWHEEMFGRPARELLGGGWQGILHADDVEGFCRDFDNAFAGRTAFSRDVRVVDRHGKTRWLHSEARPRHAEGRFIGFVGCDVDITEVHCMSEALERGIAERTGELAATSRQLSTQIEERERVEDTLRQMQRLEAIGQLTSGVAHDFNNLLTVVLGNIDMVERAAAEGPLSERSIKRLAHIRAAAERGAKLTAQLLAFSRRQRLEARPVDLNEMVAGMRDLIQSSMSGSVRMETVLQPDLWPAMVDPTQIELIILNLAINARDAMEVGGALTIATGNAVLGTPLHPEEPAAGDYVMIAVSDSGTGMTPEVRAKAFEPFFTTKAVGKGSGLGLAQVFGFAKQSGGGVAIETALGVGTTVRVYLPRAIERRTLPRPVMQPGGAERPASAAGKRVLLVDDDEPVREVTATMLRMMGAEVVECGSGAVALGLIESGDAAFDLMVVDFAMPGMNGAELVGAVRARLPQMPALFVTGYADLTAIAGVRGEQIVQKPFQGDELQRKIAWLLARAAAMAASQS